MMDFSGSNRGFAFVQYSNQVDANTAIRKLNKYEMRPNYRIGVLKSIDNCRLFIGGIPKDKSREEIFAEMEKLTDGIAHIIVYRFVLVYLFMLNHFVNPNHAILFFSNITDKSKNRGFAFVEYVSHRAASKARRKLIPNRVLLWGREIAVDWAQPETEFEEEVMCKVRMRSFKFCTFQYFHNFQTLFIYLDVIVVRSQRIHGYPRARSPLPFQSALE